MGGDGLKYSTNYQLNRQHSLEQRNQVVFPVFYQLKNVHAGSEVCLGEGGGEEGVSFNNPRLEGQSSNKLKSVEKKIEKSVIDKYRWDFGALRSRPFPNSPPCSMFKDPLCSTPRD